MVGRHVVAGEAYVLQKPGLLSPGFPVARTSSNRTISVKNRPRQDFAAATAAIPLVLLPQPRRPVYEPSGSICVPAHSQGEASDFLLNFWSSFSRNGQNIGADGAIADGGRRVGDGLFLTMLDE